jgi:hypothetical protein
VRRGFGETREVWGKEEERKGRGGAATPSTSKTLLHSEEASDSLGLTVLYILSKME